MYSIEIKPAIALRINTKKNGREIGRVWIYFINNDLHTVPYALLEDLFVEPEHRKHGLGRQLVAAAITEASVHGCYKIIACSRHPNVHIHSLYQKMGFAKHGDEFRLEI